MNYSIYYYIIPNSYGMQISLLTERSCCYISSIMKKSLVYAMKRTTVLFIEILAY